MSILDRDERRRYHRTADPDKRFTRWREWEFDMLRRMRRQGRSMIDIARMLGRSYVKVRAVVKSLETKSRTQ